VSLYELHTDPGLDQPALIVALEGWIDAGGGAASAAEAIASSVETVPVATFDTDALLDHRARRPVMHIVDGVNVDMTWPTIELSAAVDEAGEDVLLLFGPEPDHSWPSFSRAVIDLALELGVRMVLGLGAYPAPVPHTRPVRLASTASTPSLARIIGFVRGTLDVPAGVQAAIERQAADLDLAALGLWAQVPHYAAAMPYPAASARLLEGLAEVGGAQFDAEDLHRQAKNTESRLDALVAESDEHQELVRQLEIHADEVDEADIGEMELRSGDELAAELERFLREQGD
jgi:proteasome assembly chaperone (PAC2) family protein